MLEIFPRIQHTSEHCEVCVYYGIDIYIYTHTQGRNLLWIDTLGLQYGDDADRVRCGNQGPEGQQFQGGWIETARPPDALRAPQYPGANERRDRRPDGREERDGGDVSVEQLAAQLVPGIEDDGGQESHEEYVRGEGEQLPHELLGFIGVVVVSLFAGDFRYQNFVRKETNDHRNYQNQSSFRQYLVQRTPVVQELAQDQDRCEKRGKENEVMRTGLFHFQVQFVVFVAVSAAINSFPRSIRIVGHDGEESNQ